MLKSIFFSLFTHISIGLIFTILFISKEEIGKLYFRVTTLVAFTLLLTAIVAQTFGKINFLQLLAFNETNQYTLERITFLLLILSIIFILLYNLFLHRVILFIVLLLGIIAIAINALLYIETKGYNPFEKALFITNAISSTLILGSVLGAMITGHWYLVKHKLSLNPLKNTTLIYIFSVLFRIFVIVLTISIFWKMEKTHILLNMIFSLTTDSLFLIGRVVIGLIIPLIFGIMIWGTVKIRSTQSATGILYATIILVLIGEAFAKFISNSIGIPL
ncbi:MAG: hypothetical protein ACE5JB_07475 [bacterium]